MSEMSRLRWLCRRGMKELDVVLGQYLERKYPAASAAEQNSFRRLLEMDDPDLYRLLVGQDRSEDEALQRIADALRMTSQRR